MLFSSLIFLVYFLPIFLLSFYATRKSIKTQNIVILAFSLFFYSFGEPVFILVMLFSILMNFLIGLYMDRYRHHAKAVISVGIIANLSLLFYFKYFTFFITSAFIPLGINLTLPDIALPIGISFFTFQAITYLVDLYRKHIKVQKNLINLSLYISLFPQLIAGPIVRYEDVEKQITKRILSYDRFYLGLRRFLIGLGKKVLIANYFAIIVDNIFAMNMSETSPHLWYIAIFSYAMQIYFDFSGYSDMAIGIARMIGFDLKENFNYPYLSKSITEFWRRWHISLSSFLKDYLYIPLGGNRKGVKRTYINLFIVFLLCGLWHGASWNFILWGAYFAFFLVLERIFLSKWLEKSGKCLSWLYTIIVVFFAWMIFRAESITQIGDILNVMANGERGDLYKDYVNNALFQVMVAIAIFSATPVFKKYIIYNNNKYIKLGVDIFLCAVLYIVVVSLAKNTYNPFIYFRF